MNIIEKLDDARIIVGKYLFFYSKLTDEIYNFGKIIDYDINPYAEITIELENNMAVEFCIFSTKIRYQNMPCYFDDFNYSNLYLVDDTDDEFDINSIKLFAELDK